MSYEIFKKLCDERGVKPADITRATGIKSPTFSSWKNGDYEPKQDKLQLIADYFNVPVEYLKTGEVKEGYYLNEETAQVAQQIVENHELGLLFDAAKDASPEDLLTVHQMLLALKRKENGEY